MSAAVSAIAERPTRRPVRIVHVGFGRFFRAHQAWYTARAGDAADWGIAAFTVRSPTIAADLAEHQGVYPLIVRGPVSDTIETIDSVVAVLPGSDVDALCRYVGRPEVAVITLTVTEAGYGIGASGEADVDEVDVRDDLAALKAGAGTARSVLGRLTLALSARRDRGAGPIAVVSCDNIPGNGRFLSRGVLSFAALLDEQLCEWIRAHVSFVSTSVDRITPQVAGEQVVTEPFADWVLSGDFPAGRPDWGSAGARFVDDIEPWEHRKLWLLNGAHSILAFDGQLRGHETVAEAVADPQCRALVDAFWHEAVQSLPPGIEHVQYRRDLIARFTNPRIVHSLAQIAGEATTKVAYRLAAVAERSVASGRSADASAAAIAAWIRWVRGAHPAPDSRRAEVDAALLATDPIRELVALASPFLAASDTFVDRVRDRAHIARRASP